MRKNVHPADKILVTPMFVHVICTTKARLKHES